MTRPTIIAAAGCCMALTATAASAQTDYLTRNRAISRAYMKHQAGNGVTANGRCGGQSYGTGARSCGTATGGPVGGNGSRN